MKNINEEEENIKKYLAYDREFKTVKTFNNINEVLKDIENFSKYNNYLIDLINSSITSVYNELNYDFLEYNSCFFIKLNDGRCFEVFDYNDINFNEIGFCEIESIFIEKDKFLYINDNDIKLINHLIDNKNMEYFEAFQELYNIKNILNIK